MLVPFLVVVWMCVLVSFVVLVGRPHALVGLGRGFVLGPIFGPGWWASSCLFGWWFGDVLVPFLVLVGGRPRAL